MYLKKNSIFTVNQPPIIHTYTTLKQKNPYTFFNQFCLRTPLLPLNFYFDLTQGKSISIEKLKSAWKNPIIKEAIFLASPELFEVVENLLTGKITDSKKIHKLQNSLLKYLSRMSSRCTPFGLFAGCSIGTFSDKTHIELEPCQKNSRQTRFDMNFLVAFSQKLSKEKHIQKQLLWYPNNSLYKIGNQYRYVEYTYNEKNTRQHSIEAITHTPYLAMIIEDSRSGKKINELAMLLVDDDISIEEAEGFIDELINNQVLVSELEPSVTGDDFLKQLYTNLKKLQGTEAVLKEIDTYQRFLDQVDLKLGNNPKNYITLGQSINRGQDNFELKHLFQTDLYTQAKKNELSIHTAYKIKRLMPFLNRISFPHQNSNLEQFRNAFVKRYETREVSMATVLDTETGIGYLQSQDANDSTPFLNDLHIPYKQSSEQNYSWNEVQEILQKKLNENTNSYTLQLEDKDFENFSENWNDLPDTMSAMVEMVTINGEEKIVMAYVGGTSAANLLGRFSTGHPDILKHTKDIIKVEHDMHPDKILAEIIHLPQSRTGNVIRRSKLRDYEIPYLGKSNLPTDKQIPIDDLMIAVKHNKIILRSKKHNKEVLPKLTNAHNYSGQNSLPIYHFLCDLQKQKMRTSIGFYWSDLLEKNTFLPRVTYKDFIFSEARWKISKEQIQFLLDAYNKEEDLITKLSNWRSKLQMPKLVQLTEGDNTLLINMENNDSIKMWLETIKNRQNFELKEFLFTEKSIVRQEHNNYTNQFIISFYNEEKLKKVRDRMLDVR